MRTAHLLFAVLCLTVIGGTFGGLAVWSRWSDDRTQAKGEAIAEGIRQAQLAQDRTDLQAEWDRFLVEVKLEDEDECEAAQHPPHLGTPPPPGRVAGVRAKQVETFQQRFRQLGMEPPPVPPMKL